MEFDIINDLISDTIGRFFSNESQVSVIDDFRGLFSSSMRKTSGSTGMGANTSQSQSSSLTQLPSRNIETSPYISSTQNQPTSIQAQSSSRTYSSTSSSSTLNTSTASSQSLAQNNSIQSQQANAGERFTPVVQNNNLFDQSRQPLTPELWIQREGPNKLREAQQRLSLNLSRVSRSDLEAMTLDQLTNEKKRVKQELKMYDASFQAHFNRFPQKQEKEPLRPLYIYYKKLKQFMSQRGQAGSINDDNDDDNSRQRGQQQIQPQQSRTQNGNQIISSTNPASSNNPQQTAVIRQIEDLKRIRADLRDKLHNYQSEFFKNHNRRIRYHRDIQPVENEYRQYKDTKQELLRLEALLQRQ